MTTLLAERPATRSVASQTDFDLVAAVRRGEDAAFGELYERYRSRIHSFVQGKVCDHARAEDITQEVFFSALRRMRETERPIAFKAWIYEIAKNACIDQFRRSKRAEEISYDAEEGLGRSDQGRLVSATPAPDAAVETKQSLDHLCGAFGGLSEAHHEILVLRELEGLSYREIGEKMGMSRPAVESTLFRARRRLTEEYGELVSGQRCQRIQGVIAAAAEGMLGTRDRRRMARHLSACPSCRRDAHSLGVDVAPESRRLARASAFFPLPALAPIAGAWKAAAAAATLVVAGLGANAMPAPPVAQAPEASAVNHAVRVLERDAGREATRTVTRSATAGATATRTRAAAKPDTTRRAGAERTSSTRGAAKPQSSSTSGGGAGSGTASGGSSSAADKPAASRPSADDVTGALPAAAPATPDPGTATGSLPRADTPPVDVPAAATSAVTGATDAVGDPAGAVSATATNLG